MHMQIEILCLQLALQKEMEKGEAQGDAQQIRIKGN